jgi:hypothetical protein
VTRPDVTTLANLAFRTAGPYPSRTVLRRSQGDDTFSQGDAFIDMTGQPLLEQVRDLSLGLIALGVSEGVSRSSLRTGRSGASPIWRCRREETTTRQVR